MAGYKASDSHRRFARQEKNFGDVFGRRRKISFHSDFPTVKERMLFCLRKEIRKIKCKAAAAGFHLNDRRR